MKRRILALAAAVMVLGGCTPGAGLSDQQLEVASQSSSSSSAAAEPEEPPRQAANQIRLANSAADSLNPYLAQTQINRELAPLLYDGLTHLGPDFLPENLLAEQITVEGTLCTVILKHNVQFSDGTYVTGEDVIYSLNTAKQSQTNWATALENAVSASVDGEGRVLIQLGRADADFAALLNFPVVKYGTAGEDFPTGVSKYYVSGTWENGVTLSANPLYWKEIQHVQRIYLVQSSDPDTLSFNLRTGDIDLAYSERPDNDMSGSAPVNLQVPLTDLVYLGINGQSGLLAQPEFRQALSKALHRDELVAKAYVTRARGTLYPFHPDFWRLAGTDQSTPRQLAQADRILDALGLEETDSRGYRLRYGQPVQLELLVNSENASRNAAATLIAEQLRQLGVEIEVVSQPFEQYQASLAAHDYDLYIGEVRLLPNWDFSMLLSGGSLDFGTPYDQELAELEANYRATGQGIVGLCARFQEVQPLIPLVFRTGLVSSNLTFPSEMVATSQDIFYNITDW